MLIGKQSHELPSRGRRKGKRRLMGEIRRNKASGEGGGSARRKGRKNSGSERQTNKGGEKVRVRMKFRGEFEQKTTARGGGGRTCCLRVATGGRSEATWRSGAVARQSNRGFRFVFTVFVCFASAQRTCTHAGRERERKQDKQTDQVSFDPTMNKTFKIY